MQLLLAAILAAFVALAVSVDEIKHLPGLKFDINFKHYSGYLQVSPTHFLHYWFVESQNDPVNDPLIFWYNGGPGCSSLLGLLTEMGPYEINLNGKTLHSNPNAWNKFASVVYVEAPAGVGFSYSTDGNTTTNDDLTAQENYEGIKQFFKLHPEFRNHSTFITGESYGGVYVPTLASRIIDGQKDYKINLGGVAIGNGLLNKKINSKTMILFNYYHGLIDEKQWTDFEEGCCDGCFESCILDQISSECQRNLFNLRYLAVNSLNMYDIYGTCDLDSIENVEKIQKLRSKLASKSLSKKSITQDEIPCVNSKYVENYLNLVAVRRAIHIPQNLSSTWRMCNTPLHMAYGYGYSDMTPFVLKIVDAKVPVLLFYGDTDMMCNFLGGQQFAAQLGLPLKASKKAWFVNERNAGFKTEYEGVTFITVRGSGHMAPESPQTFYAIKQFLSGQPI